MGNAVIVIVVGLDYSELSDAGLERAFELASREQRAEVHIVNVLSPIESVQPHGPKSALLDVEIAASQLVRYVRSRVNAYAEAHSAELVPPRVRVVAHVRFDHAANAIVQLASDLSADLIVVGTHGRQGFMRFLLGSVSERVLRLSPCPVLVMRPTTAVNDDQLIEPPCPNCQAVQAKAGSELWCEQHQAKHGRHHTIIGTIEPVASGPAADRP